MVEKREWRWVASVSLAILALAWLPYLVAWLATPPAAHFAGMVYNPLDGQSYLAKMRLGAEGSWLFHVLYTPEPPQGEALIFLFHLLLGHIARWSGLSLLAVYHAARTLAGLALLPGLYRLAADLTASPKRRRLLFLLATMGAGFGWLAALLGHETPDLWVAEAFPFAALLTNAHFPTSLALMAWAAHWGLTAHESPRAGAATAVAAVALGAIQPFGLVPLLGGLGGAWLVRSRQQRRLDRRGLVWLALTALAALPYPAYTFWVTHSDPVMAAWSAQNLTPSPPLWDWLLGYGLLALLAPVGVVAALRRCRPADGLLLGWLAVTVVGLALPLALSRRLSLGLGIPIGLLAGLGWETLPRRRWRRLASFALPLSAMTALFLITMGLGAALGGHPLLYLSDGEWAALAWLRDHAPRDAVVLCAPETGVFVPAWAGQRVVYGHPFETVRAAARRAEVKQFWAGRREPAWLAEMGVEYLFYGPRERALGAEPGGELVFGYGDTAIYRR